jgi:hypothetical protein
VSARHDDDLPLRFHPLSNGEYAPLPMSPLVRETIRRTLDVADANSRRLGISRRAFLASASGMAATLSALSACSEEQRRSSPSSSSMTSATSTASTPTATSAPLGPGGTFEVPPESTIDAEVVTSVLGGTTAS